MLRDRLLRVIRSSAVLAVAVAAVGCGEGDGPTPVVDPAPPASELYTLVWADEFDVDGPPNLENWRMETGYGPNDDGWGNKEWQLYTDNTDPDTGNVHVKNGNLVITARCSEANTAPEKCITDSEDPDVGAVRTGIITSARINTKDKLEIKYGKIQARIKTPPGKGMWPAFWMLGSVFPDTPWPLAGEIDIMEMHQFFSNDRTTHFTVHWCDDSKTEPDACELEPGWTFDSRFKTFDEVLTDDYHIFEAEWDENRIIGRIDGLNYFSKPIEPGTQEEFLKRFFMILNVAVGGTLGGPPSVSITWPQTMLVDWVRVYERNQPDFLELVPEDPSIPLPFRRTVNSVEFGGDSVISDIRSTAVTPLVGDTVVEFDYQSGNTFFSGGAFLFRLKDLTHYEKLVFSLYFDDATFPDFADISIEMQDDRFNGEGDPGKTSLQLSDYGPPPVPGNWQTYEIPLTAFNLTNLDNVELFGFWNPVNSDSQLIAGKLYVDDIKFIDVPCSDNGTVSFNVPSYPPNASVAQVEIADACLKNKNKSVVAVVDNGTDAIGVAMTLDAKGEGRAAVKFGSTTSDANGTIAINDGDVLTVTYTDANGAKQSDTAPVGVFPLAVYAEERAYPVLPYFEILNQDTVTNETSAAVAPLEGTVSLEAEFKVPTSGSENGFAYNFVFPPALVNGTFEANDASSGDVFCPESNCDGWKAFESVFTNSTLGPASGPVSHDAGGTQSFTMFGPFFFDGASGAYQADNSVEPGRLYTATAHVMNWDGDQLAEGNLGILQLSFWDQPGGQDGGGNRLGVTEILVDSTDDGINVYLPPQNGAERSDWTELSITEFAPPGTASAELFLLHIQLNDPPAGGKIFWDDVSLAPEPKSNNISLYKNLKFGINTAAVSGLLADLEVRMVDADGVERSVNLSNYSPTSTTPDGWELYEIPLRDFAGLDLTEVNTLGFLNASTTVAPTITHFDGILYFDDVHFADPAITLGVYSETNIDPVLAYSEIIDSDTVTDENSNIIVALEGDVSLQADYSLPGSGTDMGFSFNFANNMLTNGTFEANDAFPGAVFCPPDNCDGWTAFESVFTKANVDQFNNFGPVSHDADGTQSLQMFGPFQLSPNASGAYQVVDSISAGTPYNATVYAMNWAPDTLTNLGIFQLSFWDAAGGQDGGGNDLGTFQVTVDSTTNPLGQDVSLAPQDGADISDWTQLSITETAPAGTVSAQVFLLHIQTDPVSGGSLFWDDVGLVEIRGADISAYATLKFGINPNAVGGLMDLQVKMETAAGIESSVFLSNYSPVSTTPDGWARYEIPLPDFNDPVEMNLTDVLRLGFWNPSSTVTGSTTESPTLLPGTLFFDDIYFEK